MNASVDQSTFAQQPATEMTFDFVTARSRLLDACFELEVAVARWLSTLGVKDPKVPMGERLKQLATNGQLAEKATSKQAKQIRELPNACQTLLNIRNAAVHSQREFGFKEGKPCVFLSTIENALSQGSTFFVATPDDMEEAAKLAVKLAHQLENYLTQASSPPRPSPAAAGDP